MGHNVLIPGSYKGKTEYKKVCGQMAQRARRTLSIEGSYS